MNVSPASACRLPTSSDPPSGVSLLKAEVEAAGVSCSVLYPNIAFARTIGLPEYRFMTEGISWRALAAEWVFARSLYGSQHGDGREYVDEVLTGTWKLPRAGVDRVLEVRERAEAFVQTLAADVPWETTTSSASRRTPVRTSRHLRSRDASRKLTRA